MSQNYEDIVCRWYNRLKPAFLRSMIKDFSYLTLFDAENIYQDTFIVIQENLKKNKIGEDTPWQWYISKIGRNLALKEYRRKGITVNFSLSNDEEESNSGHFLARKVEDLIKTLPDQEDDSIYRSEEVQSILGNELIHSPEPCASIIRLFYYEDLSMEEIAKEIGYKNADSAKAKKSQCMKDLINRLSKSLHEVGYFLTPKKRNKNGKN